MTTIKFVIEASGMEFLTVTILLTLAYLNVSALVDIEHRVHTMKVAETFLRFGWSLFLLCFMAGTFVILTWLMSISS